jgi:PilZ domain
MTAAALAVEASTPWATEARDRRRASRVPLWGLADIRVGSDQATRHLIEDLSVGGAQLVGAPAPSLGTKLELVMRVPFRGPLRLAAEVVRQSEGPTTRFGVAFRGCPDDTQDALLTILARRVPKRIVIIVDDDGEDGDALGRHLRRLGCLALLACSPVDARRWLRATESNVHMVIVVSQLAHPGVLELLTDLEARHPHVRRAILSGRARPEPPVLARNARLDHATLCRPWSAIALTELVVFE